MGPISQAICQTDRPPVRTRARHGAEEGCCQPNLTGRHVYPAEGVKRQRVALCWQAVLQQVLALH